MQHRKVAVLWSLLVILAIAVQPAMAVGGTSELAPLLITGDQNVISGQYIVVFKQNVSPAAVDAALTKSVQAAGSALLHRYSDALAGFAARLPDAALEALRRNPNVDYIEADQAVTLDTTQTGATWGLDRIDQRNLPLNSTYIYNNTGSGVKAYIIDTGIRTSHNEFGGRASIGTDTVGDGQNGQDCNGHGTHVAGTVGGSTYGVAKAVTLIAVRVLNCSGSGTTSGVIAGVDWVTSNHSSGQPAVANMSLGGSPSTALDNAVKSSISDGVTYSIAAGNSSRNACNYSPARVTAAITVGATNKTDTRPTWSNFGSCLDLFAPGVSITSSWNSSNTATNTISGTSMAAPHVAGVAALYLQSNSTASPATVRNALVDNATSGVVKRPGNNSPNLLLFSDY